MRLPLRSPRGTTLPELLVAVTVAAILGGIAVAGAARLTDVLNARGAARELRAALETTRHLAVLRATRAAFTVDTARASLAVRLGADTAIVRELGALYGIRLSASRDSIAYAANGLGWGAANARLVARRGAAAETVTVSRLGRVR
ncbi:MAG: prepilin-type N-terminal cleavage/methylation domain-containing protein [Gemmatirosa sp.]|nr:prepilin-type N-terminal cleavage/methylation domain-containing protein [Gemmatirosa sp.]